MSGEQPAQPDPVVWPECKECGVAYVLRKCIVFGDSIGFRWLWQIDCKHKKAGAIVANADGQVAS